MTGSVRRGAGAAALAVSLALSVVLGGCSGDDEPDRPAASGTPSATTTPEPVVKTEVGYGKVTGRLSRQVRKHLAREISGVTDHWLRAAFVAGPYPRKTFDDSWPGFTRGARAEAHRDRTLMSNADIGARVDDVQPVLSRLWLDVLAVRGHAAGVTARMRFAFRTTGKVHRKVRIQGRLYLTRTDHGWKIFGYDMSKGRV